MSGDDVAIYVAGYAAAVGTLSLLWQVSRERARRRTDVRVETKHGVGEGPEEWDRPGVPYYFVRVGAVNYGETTEYVVSLDVESPEGDDAAFHEFADPYPLPPRARVDVDLQAPQWAWEWKKGLVGGATLASGKHLRSQPELPDESLLEELS